MDLADSLQQLLRQAADDRQKVDWLNDLAWEYKFDDPALARQHLNNAITLADQLAYKKGKGQAYNNLGVVETIHGNTALAIAHYSEALAIRRSLDDQKGVASLYNNIGNLYAQQDSFGAAINNLKQSLAIRESLQDTQRIARVHYNLADVYESVSDYTTALDHAFAFREWSALTDDSYNQLLANQLMGNIFTELERWEEAGHHFRQAVAQAEQLDDERELAAAYNNLANHKDDLGEKAYKDDRFSEALPLFNEAVDLHQKALALRQKTEENAAVSDSYNNLGVVHKNFGSYYDDLENPDSAAYCYKQALQYFNQSLQLRTEADDQQGLMEVYNGIGDVKRRQQHWQEALDYTRRYLAIAKNIDDRKFEQKAYKDLSRVFAESGAYQEAYQFRKKYDELRYQRLSEDQVRMNARREAIFGDFNKKLELERTEAALRQAAVEKKALAIQRAALAGGGIALLLLALLLLNRYRLKNRANKALEEKNKIIESERQKSDDLLHNILPGEIAAELKQHHKTTARHYKSVSVLFTDFKSFTKATEQMTAAELVDLLDRCYRHFDEIVSQYGVEKIKTIGDAYMAAAGLPTPNDTHAHDMVRAGLAMQQAMRQINAEQVGKGLPELPMRVGIHSGPVVAGVVGSKKFAYDIWGDAVNLAARMESGGMPGEVNISAATFGLIKNTFQCQHRGRFEAKNKGEIDMYFVVGEKDISEPAQL